MEINLDENSLSVLRNIFEWTDLDCDGKVSRDDLLNSLGLQSEQDANQLFRTLKDLAGSDSSSDYLTFEEYCKSIMDFPLLLDKFKQDFQSKSISTYQIPERSESHSSQSEHDLSFLPGKLREAILIYSKILKIDIPDLDSPHAEDLLEALRLCLEALKNKSRNESLSVSDILNGTIELYLLVRDLSRYHEEVAEEKDEKIFELQGQYDTLNRKYERVLESNEKLLNSINKLEKSRENYSQVNEVISEEKKKLEMKLADAESQENDYNSYIKQIEHVIMDKEKEIARMEKQIRQLNSLKTLQEMRVTTGRPTEEMKVQRLAEIKYRQSVPVNRSPDRGHKNTSSNSDIKVTIISNQLKKKNEEYQIKLNENNQLEFQYDKLQLEVTKLKEETLRLNERIRNLQLENCNKKNEDRDSVLLPSLYDELQLLKEGSVNEYQKSVLFHHYNEAKNSHKHMVELREFSTQTEEKKKKKIEPKDRSCCSWF